MIHLTDFPTEILLYICTYFDVKDLLNLSLVSSQFNAISSSNVLWKELARIHWKSKRIAFQLFHRLDYSPIIKDLSIKEMKKILSARKTKYNHLIEKNEFKELVLASTPLHSYKFNHYPKWKASYAAAQLDSKRTKITKDELCSRKWIFKFTQWAIEGPDILAQFHPNYTYTSDLFDRHLNWRFYAGDIQVEQYPTTHCVRTSDWGWIIQNEMVVYYEYSGE